MKRKNLLLILIAGILLISSNSVPLANAQPAPTSLTITVPDNPPWKTCTIRATLKDEYNDPLQNFDIDFLWRHVLENGTSCGEHWLAARKTDSEGVASLTYTFWSTGTYNVTATFSGTPDYAPSSSEYIEIIIINYTPYLVGGGLIALAITGVAGYLVFRRRKEAIKD